LGRARRQHRAAALAEADAHLARAFAPAAQHHGVAVLQVAAGLAAGQWQAARAARSRFLPETPTVAEAGFKALEQVEWYGFFLPGKAAPEVVQRAASAIRAALSGPEVPDALAQFGLELALGTPADLETAVRAETAAWAPIVKRVGFMPDQ
jgi:tripartite-type tricarboxylate transporter receptor subunit TctC